MENQTIRLWTIQPVEVWESLQERGELRCDITRSSFYSTSSPDFVRAYDWLREQMRERVCGYQGGYSWWAWAERRPDLRRETWHLAQGKTAVRIELEMPRSQVLLSCFEAWEAVLFGSYCSFNEHEEADFERLWQSVCARFAIPSSDRYNLDMYDLLTDTEAQVEAARAQTDIAPEAWERIYRLRARIRQSWERIFDMDWIRNSWHELYPVQATFEVLRKEQVVTHTTFQGRWKPQRPSGAKNNER